MLTLPAFGLGAVGGKVAGAGAGAPNLAGLVFLTQRNGVRLSAPLSKS